MPAAGRRTHEERRRSLRSPRQRAVPCRVVPCCAVPCRAVLSGAGAAAAPSARPVAGAVPPRRAVLLLPAARAGLAREAE